ncbi:MAG: SLC13 family permease [Candidatus Thorarchaeota archaeon]|nr:SLC13 family permease [Candidatus Thorarchaeota archaeon]
MQEPVGTLILLVFIGTYVLISSEKVNRAAMSMTGMGIAGLVLWYYGTKFSDLALDIEWGTILFIVSMMAIVAVAGHSGMFQYIALTLAKPTGGNTSRLFTVFIVFVFVISLVFDTTSTMLIIGPLTIEVCKALEIDFKPFLISEAITSNFASIPSIVGAVPNLVIADQVLRAQVFGFDGAFLFIVMMPLSIILLIVTLFILQRVFQNQLFDSHEDIVEQVFVVSPQHMIRSKADFYLSLVAILFLALAFTIGQGSGLEPPLIAIIVAFTVLLIAREKVENILSEINWNTVFFLIGIFGLVAALKIVGFIDDIGEFVAGIVGGDKGGAVSFLVWVPALLSAVIDNIPVSIVLAPVAAELASLSLVFPAILVFAVNVGGYLLPIGAPANILAMALSENEHDRIDFKAFAKIATPLALLHLLIGTGWLFLMSTIF